MRELTVVNPRAGKGIGDIEGAYVTQSAGDCRRYIREKCLEDPDTHFTVCGGDGTLNEAVRGILDAGAGKTAELTARPCGSGNDTVKTTDLHEKGSLLSLDVIRFNDSFGINMLNIGFDCNVVASSERIRRKHKKISGNLSYILGVATEFFKKFGEHFTIEALCEDGESFSYDGEVMLCAVCNGQWCGGSFHNSPYSDMTDGIVEMILVKKVSRMTFLKLVGHYKDGTLLQKDGSVAIKKYKDVVTCKRIRSMTISGCKQICTDGEIEDCAKAQISILPGAIRYRV